MKIKFIKDYAINRGACPLNIGGFDMLETEIVKADTVVDLEKDNGDGAFSDELIKWLIDNGFAEEVKESGWWKPKFGDIYYIAYPNGIIVTCVWDGCAVDENRFSKGAVFKTRTAVERYRDYLEAVATVSQDEGFMRKSGGGFGWPVIEYKANNPGVDDIAERQHAGEFYFDTREHALNSAMNHTREWQTIINYDWSRE